MEFAKEMYKEHIIDLYKNPLNFGYLNEKTHEHYETNPLCGDEITIQLKMINNKVDNIKFFGKGCAISMASASLITDKVKGMSINEIIKLNAKDILDLMQIPIGPIRLKCALLPLQTIKKAIE